MDTAYKASVNRRPPKGRTACHARDLNQDIERIQRAVGRINRCSPSSPSPPDRCIGSRRASVRLPGLRRLGHTNGYTQLGLRTVNRPNLNSRIGAGAGIRTPDPRFKSSTRTPQDASSCLLPNSDLRISPPPGSLRLPGLAIQIGYTLTTWSSCERLPSPSGNTLVRVATVRL